MDRTLTIIFVVFKVKLLKKYIKYKMMRQQQTSLRNALSKQEVEAHFSKMFEDQSNAECFQCGKKCRQWVDKSHAIFLCLNCAALYRQFKGAVNVKSIGLDLWSKKQLDLISHGGNRRFKEFLSHYELDNHDFKDTLNTKATQYYRILLVQQVNGRQPPESPTIQAGKQIVKDQIPFTQMTTDEMLQFTKQKAFWLGSKTKQLGEKAYTKIQKKVSSGQLQQDAKNVAKQVKTKAKALWQFALTKINQFKNDDKQQGYKKPTPPDL